MRKRSVKKWIFDKLLLIILATIILCCGVGWIFFLEDSAHLSKEWVEFFGGCFIYLTGMLYLAVKSLKLGKNAKTIFWLLLALFTCLPILIFFSLFYFGLLPMPNFLMPYLMGSIVLVPLLITGFEYCLKLYQRKCGQCERRSLQD